MATRIQFRRGTTAQHASFTGAVGEMTVDTDKDVVVVHDGSTAGGFEMLREDLSNINIGGTATSGYALKSDGDGTYSWGVAGGVVQIKQVTIKDAYSYSGSSYQNMAIQGTITPSSANNYILVNIVLGRISNTGNNSTTFRLQRNGSNIILGNASGSRHLMTFANQRISTDGNHTQGGISYMYLDYPNTTSACTYRLQGLSESGGTFYLNRSANDSNIGDNYSGRGASTVIMMEIAGGIVS